MKLYFKSAEELKEGLLGLQEELGFSFADEADADYVISVNETEKACSEVSLNAKEATITYGGGKARFYRAFAFLMDAIKQGKESFTLAQEPAFETNGPMLDVTGGASMSISTLEFFMRRMALMGLNMLMLYTEDNYEIEGRPYFGHFRGKYTKEELKHLDAYAKIYGIELIPCIQVLGHLAGLLQWDAAAPFKDTDRVLLAGAEETYRLIGDMFKTVKECFSTNRVHIGMDETFDLGLGAYLKKNPYRKMEDLYLEHLNKVAEMADQYGLEPMIWSDMFFRFDQEHLPNYRTFDSRVTLTDKIINMIPKNVGQVCWIYDTVGNGFEKEFYTHAMSELMRTGNRIYFAGATRNWSGFTLQYGPTLNNASTGLQAAMEVGVKEVFATVWGGSEHSLLLSLPGLALYAAIDYMGKYDEDSVKETFRVGCHEDFDLFMQLEKLDRPNLADNEYGISRQVTFNDPLLPLLDVDFEKYDIGSYYKKILPELKALPKVHPYYQPLFDMVIAHCDMLSNKADFGIRAKKAYDAKDTETLAALSDECSVIIEKLQTLRKVHRNLWYTYNKAFGWEPFDTYYAGLMARFETTQFRLDAYLKGEIDSIEELAEIRLSYSGATESKAMSVTCRYNSYTQLMSRNHI